MKDKSESLVSFSREFSLYRTIGVVCNQIPCVVNTFGSSNFIISCVGKTYHIYDVNSLNLKFIGPIFEDRVLSLSCCGETVAVAHGEWVSLCQRSIEVSKFRIKAKLLYSIGDSIICAASETRIALITAPSEGDASGSEVNFIAGSLNCHISCILHPDTYLNKILVGYSNGKLELWNIKTRSLVFEFPAFENGITSISQSPVIDVVAITLRDGSITFLNIKGGDILLRLKHKDQITSTCFVNGNDSRLVCGSENGTLYMWDLDSETLIFRLDLAHSGSITMLSKLVDPFSFISSSSDGAIKVWRFCDAKVSFSVLRERQGLEAPPKYIEFYDEWGSNVLCGSEKGLHLVSVVKDSRSYKWKSSRDCIKAASFPMMKFNEWPSIVAINSTRNLLETYSIEQRGKEPSFIKSQDNGTLDVVSVSPCGNFLAVGSSLGLVSVYILQSLRLQCSIYCGKNGAVTGICFNEESSSLFVANQNGTLMKYKVLDGREEQVIQKFNFAVEKISLSQDFELIAVFTVDGFISIIDIQGGRIIRRFSIGSSKVIEMEFSPDTRKLFVASSQGVVITYNVVVGKVEDRFEVSKRISSISVSPNGAFLAIGYADEVGIELWASKRFFSWSSSSLIEGENSELQEGNNGIFDPEELRNDQSLRLKWKQVIHQETIKSRNKSAPLVKDKSEQERLPFFLDVQQVSKAIPVGKSEGANSSTPMLTTSQGILEDAFQNKDEKSFFDKEQLWKSLCNLSPSEIEYEVLTLPRENLQPFLALIEWAICNHQPFNACQAILSVFLKVHYEVVLEEEVTADDDALIDNINTESILAHLNEISSISEKNLRSLDQPIRKSMAIIRLIRHQ